MTKKINIIEEVKETITKFSMLDIKKDKVIVSISGGPDSVFLLHVLFKLGVGLSLAHINYQLRGEESDEDEEFVKRLAHDYNLEIYIKRVDTLSYSKNKHLSIQEAARRLRYEFYKELMQRLRDYTTIACGHTLDDHIETILLFFLRGTSPKGLSGIPPVRTQENYKIIRPLIRTRKEDIKKYMKDFNLSFRLDTSNTKPIYQRNKIRLELLPTLKKYNPKVEERILSLSELILEDELYLHGLTLCEYKSALLKEAPSEIKFDIAKLKCLQKPILYRIIKESIKNLQNLHNITCKNIIDIAQLIHKEGNKTLYIAGGIKVSKIYNTLSLLIEKNLLYNNKRRDLLETPLSPLLIDIGREMRMHGLYINSKILEVEECNKERFCFNRDLAYFDYEKIKLPIYVRSRKEGDRFRPYGMHGSKKLKDFFIDLKVPPRERNNVPLLVDAEKILWVVGYRTSEDAKLTNKTKKILEVCIRPELDS